MKHFNDHDHEQRQEHLAMTYSALAERIVDSVHCLDDINPYDVSAKKVLKLQQIVKLLDDIGG